MHAAQIVQLVYGPWTESIKSYANFLDLKEGGLAGVSALPTLRECISGSVPYTPSSETITDSLSKLEELNRLNNCNLSKLNLNPRADMTDAPPEIVRAYTALYGDVEAMTKELSKYLTTLKSHF